MRTNVRGRTTWGATIGALALLALTAGTGLAADPASMTYYFSSHPMISGTVVAVNDHQMVVNTDQGEQVTLEVDTRTMAPRDLGPGMIVRADFQALEDCRFYARAITPLRGSASTERLQAYANTRDLPEVIARNATAEGARSGPGPSRSTPDGLRVTAQQRMGEHSTGSVMTATPTTADYVHSTRPMVSGRVVTVNDHRLVVRTEQGQRVGMVMDSRTMLSREVAPDTFVRTEFARLVDGRYYAKSVDIVGDRVAEREQAYAHTIDSDALVAQDVQDCDPVYAGSGTTLSAAAAPYETRETAAPVAARFEEEPVREAPQAVPQALPQTPSVTAPETLPETLPQTASGQPLILLIGLLSIAAAGAMTLVRGLRAS